MEVLPAGCSRNIEDLILATGKHPCLHGSIHPSTDPFNHLSICSTILLEPCLLAFCVPMKTLTCLLPFGPSSEY